MFMCLTVKPYAKNGFNDILHTGIRHKILVKFVKQANYYLMKLFKNYLQLRSSMVLPALTI